MSLGGSAGVVGGVTKPPGIETADTEKMSTTGNVFSSRVSLKRPQRTPQGFLFKLFSSIIKTWIPMPLFFLLAQTQQVTWLFSPMFSTCVCSAHTEVSYTCFLSLSLSLLGFQISESSSCWLNQKLCAEWMTHLDILNGTKDAGSPVIYLRSILSNLTEVYVSLCNLNKGVLGFFFNNIKSTGFAMCQAVISSMEI